MAENGLEELIVEIEKRLGEEQLELFKLEGPDGVKTFRDRVLSYHKNRHLNRDFEDCVTFADALINRYRNKFGDEEAKWNFIAELGKLLSESKLLIFLEEYPTLLWFLKWFFNLLFPPLLIVLFTRLLF